MHDWSPHACASVLLPYLSFCWTDTTERERESQTDRQTDTQRGGDGWMCAAAEWQSIQTGCVCPSAPSSAALFYFLLHYISRSKPFYFLDLDYYSKTYIAQLYKFHHLKIATLKMHCVVDLLFSKNLVIHLYIRKLVKQGILYHEYTFTFVP